MARLKTDSKHNITTEVNYWDLPSFDVYLANSVKNIRLKPLRLNQTPKPHVYIFLKSSNFNDAGDYGTL